MSSRLIGVMAVEHAPARAVRLYKFEGGLEVFSPQGFVRLLADHEPGPCRNEGAELSSDQVRW